MKINKSASLKNYNTFGVEATANCFIEIENKEDILTFSKMDLAKEPNVFILGGGSNVLFTKDVEGTILHSSIKDINVISETEEHIIIRCGSGVCWDYFVEYCVSNKWGGIENLSDIPGNVGAAPVQNIGAYGVEAKDSILSVETVDFTNGDEKTLNKAECKFEYRNSIFKNSEYKNHFVCYVHFRLLKSPQLITNYGRVAEELKEYKKPTIQNLRDTILKIRRSKLPSTDELGNGGSFFKNPIVKKDIAEELTSEYPDMPKYALPDNRFKLSSAWLIDNAGLKGLRNGNVGTYPNQALVIVNYGGATGKEIVNFSKLIQEKVFDKYSIELEPEVIFR